MNKKFLSAILFGALMVTSTGTFVSCKDYDDDIDSLQGQVDTNVSAIDALKSQLSSLQTAGSAAQAAADAAKATADAAKAAGDTAKAAAEEAKAAVAQAKADAIAEAAKQVEALKAIVEANKLSQDQLAAAIAPVAGQIEGIEAGLSDLKKLIDANGNEIAKALAEIEAIKADLALQKDVLEKLKETSTTDGAIDAKIEEVNETIALLYNELQSNIGSTASALQAFMDEYAETMAAIVEKDNTLEANISLLTNTIMALNDKDDQLDTEISNVWAAINGTGGIQEQMTSLINRINDIDSYALTLHTLIGKNLTSLVFVPNLYLDGVEATRYAYAPGAYQIEDADRGEATGSYRDMITESSWTTTDFTIPATSKWQYEAGNRLYVITPVDSIYYHLNPANAKLNDIVWGFNSNDAEAVSRATTQWIPEYKASVANDGVLSVAYSIKNADKLSVKKELLSVMSLHATLPNDTVVNSDYSAVLPAIRILKAIGFNDDVPNTDGCTIGDELWITGKKAAENDPSITVTYNEGPIDLDKLLNIHYTQKDFETPEDDAEHQIMDYKTALENYGLKFEYEMLPYMVGANKTSESLYGKVVNNWFYPCYVKAGAETATNPEDFQVECPVGFTEEGISAVGKMPIVLVKLIDKVTNQVVLNGYIKIKIVKEKGFKDFTIKEFELPMICGYQTAAITWDEASDLIYEYTKYSKLEFMNTFSATTGNPFIKKVKSNGDVEFVQDNSGDWGYIFRNVDGTNRSSTNEIIYWTGNLDQLKNIADEPNRSKTLYVKYTSKADQTYSIYVGITIKAALPPVVTFGEKIAKYWYDDITGTAQENVRNNVPRPTTAGINTKDVLKYTKDLDDNFKGNTVTITKTDAAQNKLYDLSKIGTAYSYQFAKTQPKVGTYQLARSINNTQLLVTLVKGKEVEVAELNASGELEYKDNETAKEILNLFSHSEKTADKMQYANVEIVATYGTCEEPLGTYGFNVRFLRPVDVLEGPNAFFEDAQANGSSVVLGDFIKLQDWRDMDLIKFNGTKYVSAVENDCQLFDYYLFNSIKIDIDNASSTLTGKKEPVKDVTDKLQLKVNDNGTEYDKTTEVTINSVDVLNTTKIVYFNNEGNVQEFELYIPIEIEYSWGILKSEIVATVGKTKAN